MVSNERRDGQLNTEYTELRGYFRGKLDVRYGWVSDDAHIQD